MILELFSQKESVSITELWNSMPGPLFKISLKNVSKRFNYFLKLNLIHETGERRYKKLYRLTADGVYYLLRSFSDKSVFLMANAKTFFQNYLEDELLKTFLYKAISIETVKNLSNPELFRELLDYLHKCCIAINSLLTEIQQFDNNMIVEVINSSRGTKELLDFLERMTGYNGLNYTIRKDDVRKKIYIDTPEVNYTFDLKKEPPSLILKRTGLVKDIKSFDREMLNFDFDNVVETTVMRDFLIERFQTSLSRMFYANVTNILLSNNQIINSIDLEILSRDDKFMAIANELKKRFFITVNELEKLRT